MRGNQEVCPRELVQTGSGAESGHPGTNISVYFWDPLCLGRGMCLWVLWAPCKVMLYLWSLTLPSFLLAATDSVFLSYSTCGPKWPHPSAPGIREVFRASVMANALGNPQLRQGLETLKGGPQSRGLPVQLLGPGGWPKYRGWR